jgi:phosphatidylserine/phosphatidylglycerophosphate/cardiolipin synthase-like enzyme
VVATSAVATGQYGVGSGFFWDVGIAYRNPALGEMAPGALSGAPPSVALLGEWPGGAVQSAPLRSTRGALLEMIGEAQVLVDLTVPELGEQAVVEPLLWALQEAADRGVRVRVLADPSARAPALDALRGRRGIEVRRAPQGVALLAVDRGEACLAGEALRGDARRPELALLVRAPATLRAIEDVFDHDWSEASGLGVDAVGPPAGGYRLPESAISTPEQTVEAGSNRLALRPLFAPRGRLPSEALWAQPALVSLIDSARQSLRLHLSLARGGALDAELLAALQRAADRGVQVQALVADRSATERDLAPLRRLASRSVEVRVVLGLAPDAPEALSFVSVDGARAWLGSGGLGVRSLAHDRNAGLLIDGPALARLVDRWFAAAWHSATEPLASR